MCLVPSSGRRYLIADDLGFEWTNGRTDVASLSNRVPLEIAQVPKNDDYVFSIFVIFATFSDFFLFLLLFSPSRISRPCPSRIRITLAISFVSASSTKTRPVLARVLGHFYIPTLPRFGSLSHKRITICT